MQARRPHVDGEEGRRHDDPVEVRSGNAVWTVGYTPMGSLRRVVRRTPGMRAVSAREYGYDAYERLLHVENERGERYTFVRDPNGEVVAERSFDGRERRYERDMDGTVLVTHLPDGTAIHHQHDLAGGSPTTGTPTARGRRGSTTAPGGPARPATSTARRCSSATRWAA